MSTEDQAKMASDEDQMTKVTPKVTPMSQREIDEMKERLRERVIRKRRTRSITLKEQQERIEVAREEIVDLYEAMYALTMDVEDAKEVLFPDLRMFEVYTDLIWFCKRLCKIDRNLDMEMVDMEIPCKRGRVVIDED